MVHSPLVSILLRQPFLPYLYDINLSIKDLKNLADLILLQNLHPCIQKSVCATNFGPFGEIVANCTNNFYREYSLLKLQIQKLSPKFNVKNIKNRVKFC